MNQALRFGPYRLDPGRGLWRGRQEVKLPPKALALLTALAERAGELVSKDEMLRAVWPETVVSDTALTSCIQELRHALHDDARVPRYIETRHRRGYRFIARTVIARPPRPPSFPRDAGRRSSSSRALVGRERELAQLRAWFARVHEGERQVVFVTGEPGIGKTTLVEAFLAWAAAQPIRIGRGQCVEHYGAGEAYLPVFDALARLTRRSDGDRVVRTLATHAPTWLTQMPFLTGGSEQEALQRRVQGATRQRMLRELTDALETLVLDVPVVLSLEDLHWSDVSTLDWLAFLGRRTDRAPLMVIGTYRPEEVLAREHQLEVVMNELRVHHLCRELPLSPLREADVARYVARRLRGRPARALATEALTRLIHARSDGNPLFMVTIVEDLITRADHRRGSERPPEAMTIEVPRDVRSMIVQQHRRLGAVDRRVLEAASVVGTEFTVPVVAASAGIGADDVEFACDGLAERGQFLVARGVEEWPDGTIAPRYAFVHALHREVLYEQVPVGRRARLHERAGGRLEAGWSGRANEIAAALAMHFEQAGSTERAVRYLHEAGTNAIRRNAPGEAIAHLTRAIELLGAFHGAARPEQELPLQIALGSQLMAIKGWGAPDVERAYGRAHRLARQVGDARGRFQVLWGLWLYHWGRGELAEAHALGEELLALAERAGDRALLLQAHHALWPTLFCRGEFRDALGHAYRGTALYEPDLHGGLSSVYGNHDAGVCARMFGSRAEALCGVPGAAETSDAAVALARRLGQPFSEALALYQGAALHQFLGDVDAVRERAGAAITLSRAHDFRLPLAAGTVLLGWAIARGGDPQEGIARIQNGMGLAQASGTDLFRPYYLVLLAEGYAVAGHAAGGLASVDEGLATAATSGARFCDAELHRIRSGLLRLRARDGDAVPAEADEDARGPSPRASLATAIEIARAQGASALEARALADLRRLEEEGGVAHGR